MNATRPASPHIAPRPDWLAQVKEPALEPALAIIDAHHHLWDRSGQRYLFDEYRADIEGAGHHVVATVYVQCRSMFDLTRPEALQSVGEVQFATGIAERSATGRYGATRMNAAIVAGADLRLGDAVQPVLEEMLERAGGRLRGVRNTTAWHPDPRLVTNPVPPPAGVLGEPGFLRGAGCLARHGLVLDVWAYHTQLDEVIALAQRLPDQRIVLDHLGGPLGAGPYRGRRDEVYAHWMAAITRLARCPNVSVKLGGLGMGVSGFDLHRQPLPPTSLQLAQLWRPYILPCIEHFGVQRCLFESNFPVDKGMYGYGVLWNAFKRLTEGSSASERASLFSRTAATLYRIQPH
ncbi:MAG: amidohydrolase family protein [Pseudomonas oryzihabitans]